MTYWTIISYMSIYCFSRKIFIEGTQAETPLKHVERGYNHGIKRIPWVQQLLDLDYWLQYHVVPVFPGIEILLSLNEPSEMKERDSPRDFGCKQR
jgi:hypothetical protein